MIQRCYTRGGPTVDCVLPVAHGQLFCQMRLLFGLYQNLFAALVRLIAFHLAAFLDKPASAEKPSSRRR